MPVNELDFNQISTVLNTIVEQATGQTAGAMVNTSDFVSVATTALKLGYDKLNTAISQVLGRTIFSIRPYNAKFRSMMVDRQTYGHIVRKINYIDGKFTDDEAFNLQNGQSIDPWKVNKPQAIQTNFYGANTFYKSITRYGQQLDVAFRSPEELAEFWSGVMQNISDMNEQAHEQIARMTLANQAGAALSDGAGEGQVVHLLTEYNAKTGLSLDAQTVYTPDNYVAFIRWVYARINTIQDMLTERSSYYHRNPTSATPVSGVINRHTPRRDQRLYMFAPALNEINASVLSQTFNDDLIRYNNVELVNYWQSIDAPAKINVTPSYMDTDGTVKVGEAVEKDNVFAILIDREACGTTIFNQRMAATPYNVAGDYFNYGWGWTERYWNDSTENTVVFLLD